MRPISANSYDQGLQKEPEFLALTRKTLRINQFTPLFEGNPAATPSIPMGCKIDLKDFVAEVLAQTAHQSALEALVIEKYGVFARRGSQAKTVFWR